MQAEPQLLDEAIRHLERSCDLTMRRKPRYCAALGEAYLLNNRPEEAARYLRRAIAEDPPPRLNYLLAEALYQTRQFADAEVYASIALEDNFRLYRALRIRGVCRHALGRAEEALADLRQCVEMAFGDMLSRLDLGRVLTETAFALDSAPDRSRYLLEARIVLAQAPTTPELLPEYWYLTGCILLGLGEADLALEAFGQSGFDHEAELAFRRGICHLLLDQKPEAHVAFEAAARVDASLTSEIETWKQDQGETREVLLLNVPGPQPNPSRPGVEIVGADSILIALG